MTLTDSLLLRCGHCKTLAPEYEKAASELATSHPSVSLIKVDATEHDGLSSKHDVTGFPTLKIFRDGKVSGDLHWLWNMGGVVIKPLVYSVAHASRYMTMRVAGPAPPLLQP